MLLSCLALPGRTCSLLVQNADPVIQTSWQHVLLNSLTASLLSGPWWYIRIQNRYNYSERWNYESYKRFASSKRHLNTHAGCNQHSRNGCNRLSDIPGISETCGEFVTLLHSWAYGTVRQPAVFSSTFCFQTSIYIEGRIIVMSNFPVG